MAFTDRVVLLLFALTISSLKSCRADNTSNGGCKRILCDKDTDVTALLQPAAHSVLTHISRLRHNATTNTFEAYSGRHEEMSPNSALKGYSSPFELKVIMNDNDAYQHCK